MIFVCIKHVDNSSSKCEWKKSTSFFDTRRDHSLHLTIHSQIGMKKNVIRVAWYCVKNRRKKGLKKKEVRKPLTQNLEKKMTQKLNDLKKNLRPKSRKLTLQQRHKLKRKFHSAGLFWGSLARSASQQIRLSAIDFKPSTPNSA